MPLTLFLDILIVALLLVAIIYAVVLDNHLSSTKENYRMLSRLIEQFYQAADKTQNELVKLKSEQAKTHQELLNETQKATQVKEELYALLDKIERKLEYQHPSGTNSNLSLSSIKPSYFHDKLNIKFDILLLKHLKV